VTYIIAWKYRASIFLVAETAVTVDYPVVKLTYTSFEEREISQPNKSVYEGALKLINLERAVIAMVGDVSEDSKAWSITETFKETLRYIHNPSAAFDVAITSNAPFDPNPLRSFASVVAFPNSPTPTLLCFDSNDHNIIEHHEDCLLAIGSIPEEYKRMTFQIVGDCGTLFYNNPSWFLTSVLACVQGFGLLDYINIFEKGVGGAFCGLLIGEHSIEWQSDVLFCLYDRGEDPNIKLIGSIVRDHVLTVLPIPGNHIRAFSSTISCNSPQDWVTKWELPALDFISDARYDFAVLLCRNPRIIIVIEMAKHRSNQLLAIAPFPDHRPLKPRLEISFSPDLFQMMKVFTPYTDDGRISFATFNWFPYCRNCCQLAYFVGEPATCSICRTPL